jgi:hypothetical protein
MPVEFEGGPIDGVRKGDGPGTDCELWLIGNKSPFAVYVRNEKANGVVCFKFDRYCSDQEAAELKSQYRTGQADGMTSGQGY